MGAVVAVLKTGTTTNSKFSASLLGSFGQCRAGQLQPSQAIAVSIQFSLCFTYDLSFLVPKRTHGSITQGGKLFRCRTYSATFRGQPTSNNGKLMDCGLVLNSNQVRIYRANLELVDLGAECDPTWRLFAQPWG